jgi:hypothetical protein
VEQDIMKAVCKGLCLLAVLVAAALPAWADGHAWADYNNIKYAYAGCYPKGIFTGQGESDAGDGQAFIAADGANITMYGAYGTDGLRDEMTADKTYFFGAAGRPTLQVLKPGYFIFSGYKGEDIVYEKKILSGDVFVTFSITYPKAHRALYDPLIAPMLKCLELLPPPVPAATGK